MAVAVGRLRPYVPAASIVAGRDRDRVGVRGDRACGTPRPMGLPLDDSYIYLTYAKQFGRAPAVHATSRAAATRPARRACCGRCCSRRSGRSARAATRSCGCRSGCARRSTRRSRSACGGSCARIAGEVAGRSPRPCSSSAIAPFAWSRAVGHGGRVRERAARRDAAAARAERRDGPADEAARRRARGGVAVAARGDADRRSRSSASCVVQRVRARDAGRRVVARAAGAAPVAWLVANKLLAGQLHAEHRRREESLLPAGVRLDVLVRDGAQLTGAARVAGCSGIGKSPLVWPKLVAALVAGRRRAHRAVGAARARAARRGAR